MAYIRKTRDVWEIQGNYGGPEGWEPLTWEDTLDEARKTRKIYDLNEPFPHRIKLRRERI